MNAAGPTLWTRRELLGAELEALPLGGKARGLVALSREGLDVPDFFVLSAEGSAEAAVAAWEAMGAPRVAVRSSAQAEDGAEHSFAGMYETILGVDTAEGLRAAVERCRASAAAPRVQVYLDRHGLAQSPVSVVVQELVEAEASGVLFTVDPTDPEQALLSAAWGLGEGVVQGLVPCDEHRLRDDGELLSRIARKDEAVRLGSEEARAVEPALQEQPCLSEAQVRALLTRSRELAEAWGMPLDIEFARVGERLVWLQARPITRPVPQGRRRLWDNANIIESYHGLTGPLTYSFASRAYTIVYQLFVEVMGVDAATIRQHSDVFSRMIGLVRGRVFYNLNAWYKMVSLLPGYRWNRTFMEQMMGVAEVAGDEEAPETGSRWAALPGLLWKTGGLLWRITSLERDIAAFKRTFAEAEGEFRSRDLDDLDAHELIDLYLLLERRLLWAWSTPIVNDFFVMIFFGLLRSLCEKWLPGEPGLANRLLAGAGDLASTAPAREGRRVALALAEDRELWEALQAHKARGERRTHAQATDPRDAAALGLLEEIRAEPRRAALLDAWLETYGDRSPDELKLEVPTWRQRPAALLDLLVDLAAQQAAPEDGPRRVRAEAEEVVRRELSGLRALAFGRVLGQARTRVWERESLRLLRTRVFGIVRDLFTALGGHLEAAGALDRRRDVFWLTVDEVFGWVRGTSPTVDLRGVAALREAEYARWAELPAPADRFTTWGPVWAHNAFAGRPRPAPEGVLSGTPAFGGVVEARVRRVVDPVGEPPLQGEILVTYRTDPGWLPLFDGAAAIVVERGSLLSHSAVVARELGIPTIVAVQGLMERLRGGELVRVDAGAGTIEVLEPDPVAPAEGEE